ncbi:11034_t:CDS:2 [Dentiscutata heterogama]|uniref:11034_t:CDS:1 n=1 Tax=Dentiscutata heterogama TaxID=1316150 RepID=A0ACA9LRS1_9GLOM|nr:11034_t:CDS:2 [Dentiscutata heterogama]
MKDPILNTYSTFSIDDTGVVFPTSLFWLWFEENIKKVHQSYTLKEKANVVQYAFCEGNLRAAAKFDLDKTQVGH